MRLGLLMATAFAVLAAGAVTAAEPKKIDLELRFSGPVAPGSGSLAPGLPLWEKDKGFYGLRLTAQVDKMGEGKGTLELEPNAPAFDEFGFVTRGGDLPLVTLECNLKLVKKETLRWPGPRPRQQEWLLLEIRGPKITGRIGLATPTADNWSSGRLLVHDKDGKVKYAISLTKPPPPEPCHPGCFPAGTPIRTPAGSQPVERLREGDSVTTIGPDGTAAAGKVLAVFTTKNRLVEVRTEAGNLVTTETQPLALAGGGLRAAGELKAGDRVFRWDGRERRPVTVRSVSATGRQERVFNLIVGDPVFFVADGFLVRSKPPAPAIDPPKP